MHFLLIFALVVLSQAFAGTEPKACEDALFDQARIHNILRQDLGFSAAAVKEAAYVEAELEVVGQKGRTPALFVHAPGQENYVFIASPAGGELYTGSRNTNFVMSGAHRLAILEPYGWRRIADLPDRDPALKTFVEEHARELTELVARWGYSARAILNARVYPAKFGLIVAIYNDVAAPGGMDLWLFREGKPAKAVSTLFPEGNGEAAVALSNHKLLFRLSDESSGKLRYEVVDSLARQTDRVKDAGLIKLIRANPAVLTRLALDYDEYSLKKLLSARVRPARYLGPDGPPVFVIESAAGGEVLAVIDPRFDVGDHNRYFEEVRHLVTDDGERLNVKFEAGLWWVQSIETEGTMDELREILSEPLAAESLRLIKAKMR